MKCFFFLYEKPVGLYSYCLFNGRLWTVVQGYVYVEDKVTTECGGAQLEVYTYEVFFIMRVFSKEAEVACGNIDEPKRTLTVWGTIAKYWQHKCMRVVPVFDAICGTFVLYLCGDIYTGVW